MIKIAIVEDEKEMMIITKNTIQKEMKAFELSTIDSFFCAEDFMEKLRTGVEYDILFLDIELPGISGLELGRIVKDKHSDIKTVFLTSYSEFAAESYEIEAYQYILKSDMNIRLPKVVNGLCKEIIKNRTLYRWIGNRQDREKIFYCDIIFARKIKGAKYVEYITSKGTYKERINLEDLFLELQNNGFVMVERGHIVNMNHIVRVNGNIVYLDNNEGIAISRARTAKVKEQLNEFWRSK